MFNDVLKLPGEEGSKKWRMSIQRLSERSVEVVENGNKVPLHVIVYQTQGVWTSFSLSSATLLRAGQAPFSSQLFSF